MLQKLIGWFRNRNRPPTQAEISRRVFDSRPVRQPFHSVSGHKPTKRKINGYTAKWNK